ncbi:MULTISPECIES: hypothetical protein [Sphingomonas]|uniref:Uncharacterized protein n=1 Tax=Sphingomonas molluscorum TaxID=418184 RepID=A0ABU8Q5C2_9SPHN|nr:hypothetical protein [Sphingomonas sp. JUb134]MBM7406387.1 hypothetical protein [Sphingomonas sp. JUb134]
MRRSDLHNEWMTSLDWSRHARHATEYISMKEMLSGVLDKLARHVCAPYPDGLEFFLSQAGNKPAGQIVPAEEAFTEDGRPIYSVHRRLDALMRAHADDWSIGILEPDVISWDEWERIIDAGSDYWETGIGARRAIAGITPVFCRLAAEEVIKCHARPFGGGAETVEISGRKWWDLDPDQAIRRVASCSLNLSRPFDADAQPDHLIFVSRIGLDRALIEAARRSYVQIVALDDLPPWTIKRQVDRGQIDKEAVARYLISLMDSGDYENAKNQDFEAAVEDVFGARALGRCYQEAKARAIAADDGKRARFGKRRPG